MRTNLQVPYHESSTAKALGAQWDMARKVWFVPDGVDLFPFLKWVSDPGAFSKDVMRVLNHGRKNK